MHSSLLLPPANTQGSELRMRLKRGHPPVGCQGIWARSIRHLDSWRPFLNTGGAACWLMFRRNPTPTGAGGPNLVPSIRRQYMQLDVPQRMGHPRDPTHPSAPGHRPIKTVTQCKRRGRIRPRTLSGPAGSNRHKRHSDSAVQRGLMRITIKCSYGCMLSSWFVLVCASSSIPLCIRPPGIRPLPHYTALSASTTWWGSNLKRIGREPTAR
ncbi:hypothetical protein F4802DRAFT_133389 [Xylaria palmicola]|nr:hypothetical protein F4802DRAFT_133389 [Xylaria palmicola]